MALKLWIEGDHAEALCHVCQRWCEITFSRRSLFLERSRVDVMGVLVGVCDCCGTTITIPHQSSRKLKAAVERCAGGSDDVYVDLGTRDAALMRRKANLAHAILDGLEAGLSAASIPADDLEKIKNGRFRRIRLAQLKAYLREVGTPE